MGEKQYTKKCVSAYGNCWPFICNRQCWVSAFFSDDCSMLFMCLRSLAFVYIFFVLMYAVCLVVVAKCMDVSTFEY